MEALTNLAIYLCVGAAGGYLGDRLRLPAGVLIGSMVAVILFRMVMHRPWSVPAPYRFTVQVLLGVMLGISFVPEMLKLIARAAFPILLSTLVLVGVGILLALLFTRMGYVDITTAYMGTSPGAMSHPLHGARQRGQRAHHPLFPLPPRPLRQPDGAAGAQIPLRLRHGGRAAPKASEAEEGIRGRRRKAWNPGN
jgi:membrane AbrB-like protein